MSCVDIRISYLDSIAACSVIWPCCGCSITELAKETKATVRTKAKREIELLSKDLSKNDASNQIADDVKKVIIENSSYKRVFSPFSINSSSDKSHAGSPILFLSDQRGLGGNAA